MVNSLGIVDTKKIIAQIADSYGLNLSDYSLTILRRQFLKAMSYFKVSLVDEFISQISKKIIFYQDLIDVLMIDSTELFRTPSLWREIRDVYLPEIGNSPGGKIWMPGISSGEELFSLIIALNEADLSEKIRVEASCPSEKRIESIKNGGGYNLKKIEIGEANYARLSGKFGFSKYCEIKNNLAFLDIDLIKDVEFNNCNISQEKNDKLYRMVIFRNVMLQYNLPLYERVVCKLIDNLVVGGYLVLGNKETLEHSEGGKKMILVSKKEKIYQKRIG